MRSVVQRVESASVTVDGETTGRIGKGLLVLLGIQSGDTADDVAYTTRKLVNLRVFEDERGRMNVSVKEVGGAILVVSQFTLLGCTRRGNRPDFTQAAPPDVARTLYQEVVEAVRSEGVPVECGVFQAMMKVELINDGPVTVLVDSREQ